MIGVSLVFTDFLEGSLGHLDRLLLRLALHLLDFVTYQLVLSSGILFREQCLRDVAVQFRHADISVGIVEHDPHRFN